MSNKANRDYTIDFVKSTIVVTKAFVKRAGQIGTPENHLLSQLCKDYPQMRVVHKLVKAPVKTRSNQPNLTYASMETYMSCLPDAPLHLKEFETVRQMACAQSSPYFYVKKWFLKTFPDYRELPSFDEQGNVLTKPSLTHSTLSLVLAEDAA